MRGARPVRLGKELIYAYVVVAGSKARVRMSADESDRFDLFPGKQVLLGLGDGEVGRALVTALVPAPPFVWVEMERTAAARPVSAVR